VEEEEEEEEQPLPTLEEVEAVSSPSLSDWSSSNVDFERNLEDDKDTMTETPDDSPRLEWWEETEHKAEEEDEMLEEQEALLESFATARKEERTPAARSALLADMAAYRPARGFPSKDSPRLRLFGRPLRIGARPLTATHHAP
jgi:hypothetical protein